MRSHQIYKLVWTLATPIPLSAASMLLSAHSMAFSWRKKYSIYNFHVDITAVVETPTMASHHGSHGNQVKPPGRTSDFEETQCLDSRPGVNSDLAFIKE